MSERRNFKKHFPFFGEPNTIVEETCWLLDKKSWSAHRFWVCTGQDCHYSWDSLQPAWRTSAKSAVNNKVASEACLYQTMGVRKSGRGPAPGFWNLVFYYFNSLVEKYFSLSFELVKWNFSTVDPRTAKENDTNNILQTFQQLLLPPSVNLQLHLLALSRKKSFPLSRREHFHFVVFLLFAQRLLAFLCQRHMVSTDDCHFLAARNTARRRFTLSKTFPYAAYSVICNCSDAPDCLHSSSHLRYRAIIFADQVKTWAGKQERLTVRKATRAFPRFLQSSLKLDAVHDMSELR